MKNRLRTSLVVILGLLTVAVSFVYAANTYSLNLTAASNQYADHASGAALNFSTAMTLEMWVNIASENTSGNQRSFIVKADTNAGTNKSYLFTEENSGSGLLKLAVWNAAQSADVLSVTWIHSTNTWYHVAVTWDGSTKTAKFYVNGIQQGADQVGTNVATLLAGTNSFTVGSRSDTEAPGQLMDGIVDEARIWNVVRTGNELLTNYNCTMIGTETNLNGLWHFDNNYDDSTSNANNLTSHGSPTFNSGSVGPTGGVCGAVTLQQTTIMSMGMWI